jgi:hypothetical protein
MMLCACLNITAADIKKTPPYIKVLAMNRMGMQILKHARSRSKLPVITKPSSALKLGECAADMFKREVAATDFYTLAYPNVNERRGGEEWIQSPRIVDI